MLDLKELNCSFVAWTKVLKNLSMVKLWQYTENIHAEVVMTAPAHMHIL